MSKHGRVLVAMSGGIDSSVTALMLHEAGYEVVGITMKTWDYATSGGSRKETGCCSLDSINDARDMAVRMGFHHFIVDIREEFGDYVIDNFVDEYMSGRTPNPCILCNTHIKWEALIKRADALNCAYIATGHYAQIKSKDSRYFIQRPTDRHKDQSYVLWGLSQECMARTLFPLGPYTKTEVRQMALKFGFDELSNKSESYEICFVPDNDYRGFLRRRGDERLDSLEDGQYVDVDGKILGHHEGYPFYTIGQRKGLGIAFGEPMYVAEIIPEHNRVVLGRVDDLLRNQMTVQKLNVMKYNTIPTEMEVTTMVRYNDRGTMATVSPQTDQSFTVDFLAPVKGVAPGQSAVFYENDDVLGGGIIAKTPLFREAYQ